MPPIGAAAAAPAIISTDVLDSILESRDAARRRRTGGLRVRGSQRLSGGRAPGRKHRNRNRASSSAPRNRVYGVSARQCLEHPGHRPAGRPEVGRLAGHMDAGSTFLHPDYGPGGGASPYGIPWQVTRGTRSCAVYFQYADESDRGPYPFSARDADRGRAERRGRPSRADGRPRDLRPVRALRRPLPAKPIHCRLGRDLGSEIHGCGPGWTSADAAGLPILPGLVNYDEVQLGHIDHAIRFTAQTTSTSYLWPAATRPARPATPPTPRWELDSG